MYGANACDKSPKIVTKSIQLPKLGQTIKCKFTNDEDHEWRKLNVISRAGKATGKDGSTLTRNLMASKLLRPDLLPKAFKTKMPAMLKMIPQHVLRKVYEQS